MDPRLQKALMSYRQKDYQAAGLACEQILKQPPAPIEALYLIGLCFCRVGKTGVGVKHIRDALDLRPDMWNFDMMRRRLQLQGGKSEADLWEALFVEYLSFQVVDAFLVSYPKCGRTWLRALLGKYVIGPGGDGDPLEVLRLTQADPAFCSLEVTHDDYPHWKPVDEICTNKNAYAGKKVILLVRDPRDVMVSYYFQYTRRGDKDRAGDSDFDGTLSDFVRHHIGGLPSIVAFYNAWARSREIPAGFLLVRYEDMKRDAHGALRDVVGFLGWPPRDPAFIDEIVEYGSFDNMRRMEETNALRNARLSAPEDGDPEGFKVRRGKVGGYRDYLGDADIAYIDDYLRDHLDDYFAFYK